MEWKPKEVMRYCTIWNDEKNSVCEEKERFWCGWAVEDREGQPRYLPIADLWISHGKMFATELYDGIKNHVSGEAAPCLAPFNKMIGFLVVNPLTWPPETFKNPVDIYKFFCAFAKNQFQEVESDAKNLAERKRKWNAFLGKIEQYFIKSGTWAKPFKNLPRAPHAYSKTHQSHIKEKSDGTFVNETLITDIPLHITNGEAINLLFFKITSDLNILRAWAEEQCRTIMANYSLRITKAAQGTPIPAGDNILTSLVTFENICATFQNHSYDTDISTLLLKLNKKNESDIQLRDFVYNLGIPSTLSLFSFQCLLVLENTAITQSFLNKFKLYNKHGRLTGFFYENGAYHLYLEEKATYISGRKPRRGARNSRQTLLISAKAAEVINQIITLTTMARNYLRNKGDESWKLLFLGSSSGACYPSRCSAPRWGNNEYKVSTQEAVEQFSKHTPLQRDKLANFISRIRLRTIRASRVVESYILGENSEEASQMLGHKKQRTKLLDSYLPAPIVAYIETRGVRTLQKIIICHALSDSSYLLTATKFDNLEILDAFLKNHLAPEIPATLTDPDGLDEKDISDLEQRLIIRIGVGTLSTLISVAEAVKKSPTPNLIAPTALYWARLADLLVKEIELLHDPLLKSHLVKARAAANPSKIGNLIYEIEI
ncbi:hypothetical protein [Pseudomonas chlororaphis]|uniref:hypothetical protein n=1 Tax=Pseudomonas chlororaphis TaxID=587753 RepID=UPI000F578803|nr:hypothetical protein [Pseudomonas chlororaphis]